MPFASAATEQSVPPRCELLTWDTEFFGFRIARVHGPLARVHSAGVKDWCSQQRIRCAYLLIDSQDNESILAAEESGFRLKDVRVTLERQLVGDVAMPPSVRPAQPEDAAIIGDLARTNHADSRFYADPGFPRERCDALYATWAEKSCAGYADAVFVAEYQGRAAGYITCHDDKVSGRIGLIGVAESARGGGLGRQLIEGSLHYFAQRNLPLVTVVTQGRNVGAQRLYQRNGFIVRSLELWYHGWF